MLWSSLLQVMNGDMLWSSLLQVMNGDMLWSSLLQVMNGDMLCTVPVLKVLGYKQTEDLDPTPGAHVGKTDIALFSPLVISCLLFALKLFRTRMKRYLFPLTGCCNDDH